MKIPAPVVVDGLLYVAMAMLTTISALSQDPEVYKYMSPYVVWYLTKSAIVLLSGATALKMYRSTAYSDHLKSVKPTNNGETKP